MDMKSNTGSEAEQLKKRLALQQQLLDKLLLEKYEPIAVVGMGMRLPGSNNDAATMAEFLRTGRSGVTPIPADRWDMAALHTEDPKERGKIRTAGGGFLDNLYQFDPRFFNISPKEADYMDPQHRIMLETSWEALENARIDPHTLRDSDGGVYVGVACIDYAIEVGELTYDELDASIGTGTAHSAASGRISYFLGWRGPSISLDTACSSSLTTIHLAMQGLRRGECSIALAGGGNVIHHPRNHVTFTHAHMLAPDGQCKTFDDRADGYSRSEGGAMLVLKRMSDAVRDGDRVLAVLRGSAVCQDGESGGLTVPNGVAQEIVMRAALDAARLKPADISYVEAHGTGTPLGDPIEIGAINSVFGSVRSKDDPIPVGSVKTNVGHMETAAGIGGVIKTILQLNNKTIYPHINFEQPSSHIPWQRYAVRVPTAAEPWDAPVRRAVVNSFGFAGTIASLVVEEAPAREATTAPAESDADLQLFTLSARSRRSLAALVDRYLALLASQPDISVRALCAQLQTGRAHFTHRIAATVRRREDIVALLTRHAAQLAQPEGAEPARARRVAFVFTGQGSQKVGMGRGLYARHPQFRAQVDAIDALFQPLLQRSIKDLMFGDAPDSAELLQQTLYTQPALFTLEYALAALWRSVGVEPSILIGHSIGEIVAATVAGVFDLPDAVALVAARARLMQSVTVEGGMMAVSAAADDVAPLLEGLEDVSMAAYNAPNQCVVSGSNQSLAIVREALVRKGLTATSLPVSHAFHSPLMREVYPAFREVVAALRLKPAKYPLVSNLSGRIAEPQELQNPDYWVRHIGEAVRYADGMRAIAERGAHFFVEIGPSSALTGLGRKCVDAAAHHWAASQLPSDPQGWQWLEALALLYANGQTVDWRAVQLGQPRGADLDLPTYAYDMRRCWLPNRDRVAAAPVHATSGEHALLGEEVTDDADRAEGRRRFAARITTQTPTWLADHVVGNQVVFPGAAYLEMLFALQDAVYGETARPLQNARIHEPLFVPEGEQIELITSWQAQPDGTAKAEVTSRLVGLGNAASLRRHFVASIGLPGAEAERIAATQARLRQLEAKVAPGALPDIRKDMATFYADYDDAGLLYGPRFRKVQEVEVHGELALALLCAEDVPGSYLPPMLLDGAQQVTAGLVEDDGNNYLPTSYETCVLHKKPRGPLICRLRLHEPTPGSGMDLMSELMLLERDAAGERPVLTVSGLGTKRVPYSNTVAARQLVHDARWVRRTLPAATSKAHKTVLWTGDASAWQTLAAAAEARLAESNGQLLRAASLEAAVAQLQQDPSITDLVLAWEPRAELSGVERLRAESESNISKLLALCGALQGPLAARPLHIWLLTQGVHHPNGDTGAATAADALAGATWWGSGHTMLMEFPRYATTLIDMPAADAGAGATGAMLADEWLAGDLRGPEHQVALRADGRRVRRIRPWQEQGAANFKLDVVEYGQFSGVQPVPVDDVAPGPGDIQVEMRAAGLNFKDVINALGMLKSLADSLGQPYVPLPLGFEGSGVVLAAGADSGYAAGDEVIISQLGCLQRRITLPAIAAVRKPRSLSFAQAAALPTAYVTAAYALLTLAQLKRGERVLIHAAAGGVGQAAVALARALGAEVYATASPRKWPLLQSQGVVKVMNSRSLAFADELLEATGGHGVDVVLNSLNKDYIPAGLRSLAPQGRFVELGKVGIWSEAEVKAVRSDVRYFNFDLSEFPPQKIALINQDILSDVTQRIEAGKLPALPITTYALDEREEAFTVLSRGGNIGKLVFEFETATTQPVRFAANEVCVITGGAGALGALTARRLGELGARNVVLVGRRAPDAAQMEALQREVGAAVSLRFFAADIARGEDVDKLMADLQTRGQPLAALVHGAGVLDDAPLNAQTWERYDRVFQPKVYGSWQMQRLADASPQLRYFIGYSSVAAMMAPPGQSNYAAGNNYLDALIAQRVAAGKPGLSLQWGPWGEVGMAARLDAAQSKAIEAKGILFLKPTDGLRALSAAMVRGPVTRMVSQFDWPRVRAAQTAPEALYADLAEADVSATRRTLDLAQLMTQPPAERTRLVNDHIRAEVARLLHFDQPDDVEPDARFAELGLDSLVAVELVNALELAFKVPLPSSVVYDAPSVSLLTELVCGKLVSPAN